MKTINDDKQLSEVLQGILQELKELKEIALAGPTAYRRKRELEFINKQLKLRELAEKPLTDEEKKLLGTSD
jgi:hypothetical protein